MLDRQTSYIVRRQGDNVRNFYFVAIFNAQRICSHEPAIVHTQYGNVSGYQIELARVFYGIPFAQPPIGILRWQPTLPVTKWDHKVINATQPPPACSQPASVINGIITPSTMSEDCLYLNIFTPLIEDSSRESLLPVMIVIHGGDFQFGWASQSIFESERLVNTTNVIIALIQYRIGALGFLATGNGPNDIKCNYGILDQRLAIAWIEANINTVGRDPNEI
ncbi:unnamed protein product [Rotaria socialis]|uniref:Carboxylesterase type B domain-containing protein n=1 Tax=Rotaria socialis TaxID=392032 RepID=A0A818JBM8_9BILA|nr:unnamed protein product [Rotaria socialis]CAF3533512.1 unnamed protein product [Rotaria socialis]CAF4344759.1 unnamed protein product [Rotaria socialis]CAF4778115.1 unnamed protein product [Rotaria socialis]